MKAVAAVLAALVAVGVLMYVYTAPADAPAEMTEAEIAQIEAEVLEFAEAHLSAFGELDADLLMSFWLEDNISSVSFVQRMAGTEEMSAFFDGLVASWQQTNAEWQPGSIVDVISPTMALFQGTSRQEVAFSDGRELVQRVHFTHFLRKVQGEWRIQRNHVSGGVW